MPAYVVLSDPGGLPVDGVRNWSSRLAAGGLPGDPVPLGRVAGPEPGDARGLTPAARTGQLDLLEELNRAHLGRHPDDSELEARIANFETAARMQTAVPEALDLSGESEATRRLYGLDRPETREYGTRCLLARRLVERGVRFVQLFLERPALGHPQQERRDPQGRSAPDRPAQRRAGAWT